MQCYDNLMGCSMMGVTPCCDVRLNTGIMAGVWVAGVILCRDGDILQRREIHRYYTED